MRQESSQKDTECVCPECGGGKSANAIRCLDCVQAERDRLSGRNLEPHWKVRIILTGGSLYLTSRIEPRLHAFKNLRPTGISAEWITDRGYGDTIGFLDWATVTAVSWREYVSRH